MKRKDPQIQVAFNRLPDSSLLSEMNLSNVRIGSNSTEYKYEGKLVPRVNTILSEMLHDEGLMSWANWVGKRNLSHNKIRDESAEIGTRVHEAIQKFLTTGEKETFYGEVNYNKKINSFASFLKWWGIISSNDVHVLMIEQTLICKYFGGTLDMLIQINGRIYLVDFKTSKHFQYKYHLQLAAYRRLLYTECNIVVDGVIILRLSKDEIAFQEQLIDLSNYDHLMYMHQCDQCFLSLVYAFYNRKSVEHMYSLNYK